jgi:hypothetical protein
MKLGYLGNMFVASMFGILFGFLIAWGYLSLLVNFIDSALLIDVLFVILALIMFSMGFLLLYFRRETVGSVLIVISVVVISAEIMRFVGVI